MLKIKKFLDDESGSTAIEYGLIASLVVVAIIAGITNVGSGVNNTFNKVEQTVVPVL